MARKNTEHNIADVIFKWFAREHNAKRIDKYPLATIESSTDYIMSSVIYIVCHDDKISISENTHVKKCPKCLHDEIAFKTKTPDRELFSSHTYDSYTLEYSMHDPDVFDKISDKINEIKRKWTMKPIK